MSRAQPYALCRVHGAIKDLCCAECGDVERINAGEKMDHNPMKCPVCRIDATADFVDSAERRVDEKTFGEGIFLPIQDFRRLIELAHAAPACTASEHAPVAWLMEYEVDGRWHHHDLRPVKPAPSEGHGWRSVPLYRAPAYTSGGEQPNPRKCEYCGCETVVIECLRCHKRRPHGEPPANAAASQ